MLSKRLIYPFFLILAAFTLTGLGCRQPTSQDAEPVTLTMWGLWQESAHLDSVLKAFQESTGHIVEYKKISSVATYENDLITSLAEDRGPDIFVIHHTWPLTKQGIMSPAPEAVITTRQLQEEFVDVVSQDLVQNNQIWALPTSVDSLAMFYNRDIFNQAGIPQPPTTWTDYQQMVQQVSQISRTGLISQSGGAIGTAANVNRASDIAQLLMLQSGLDIVSGSGASDIDTDVGQRALTFYTDFANKAKATFTWDLKQPFSLDAFADGHAATMFNYSYHIATIQAKNPRLNFGISEIPQISTDPKAEKKSFAAYWPFAVSAKSQNSQLAWQFLRFLTSKDIVESVNAAQNVPPARKDSIVTLSSDPLLGPFADSNLIADTWPRPDITRSDTVFNTLIDSVVSGSAVIDNALDTAANSLEQINSSLNANSTPSN